MIQHWLAIHLGFIKAGPDPYYNFWSGFGSDLTELALFGGIIQVFRHRNCHVRHCFRFGKPVSNTPYLACHKHHPDHCGDKRSVPLSQILRQHKEKK